MALVFFLVAVLQWVLFEFGTSLPIELSLALLLAAGIDVLRRFFQGSTGLLAAYGFLVLVMPFVHLVTYLFFDFGRDAPWLMWGLVANEYMWDERIARLLCAMAATGACAYAAGLGGLGRFTGIGQAAGEQASPPSYRPMSLPVYLALTTTAIGLAWISAPQDTVLAAMYLHSETVAESINFSSAGFFGYVALLFLLADLLLDARPRRRVLKAVALGCAAAVVILWLQLARGDRESLTFVVGGFALVYYWSDLARHDRPGVRFSRLNKSAVMAGGAALYVTYYTVGIMRSLLAGSQDIGDIAWYFNAAFDRRALSLDNFLVGTWTGAIMSPLSVAGDYALGRLPLRWGATYVDILLSVPPGFVADWLGYVRPIDATRGPAHEMVYGIGGTHAVVVPFMNFGFAGIVAILALWGHLLNRLDRSVVRRPGYYRLCLCASVMGGLPHWLWYGEKSAINILILWALLSAGVWIAGRASDALRPA